MSAVLPELERQLRAAHERSAHRPSRGWRGLVDRRVVHPRSPALRQRSGAVALLGAGAAVAVLVLLLALVGRRPAGLAVAARPGVVLRNAPIDRVFSLGGRLYVTEDSYGRAPSKLLRVDPNSGGVRAERRLSFAVDDALVIGGRLWLAGATAAGVAEVSVLDPSSLRVLRSTIHSGLARPRYGFYTFAYTGAALWLVSENGAVRLSLSTGVAVAHRWLGGARVLAADPRSGQLLASVLLRVRNQPRSEIERLDPFSGRVLDRVRLPVSAGVFGFVGGASWINGSDDQAFAFVARLDPRSLRPALRVRAPHPLVRTTISGQVLGGILWISAFGLSGGMADPSSRYYCADPWTGRPRVILHIPWQSQLEAADGRYLYYEVGYAMRKTDSGELNTLARLPIDPRCR